MKTRQLSFLLLLLVCGLCTGCVHEYPEDGGISPTTVNVSLKLSATDPFTAVTRAADGDKVYIHYVVEVYKNEFEGAPVVRKEVTVEKNAVGTSQAVINLPLHAARYKVVAWASAVPNADGTGGLFATDNLKAIRLEGAYMGNTRRKECYDGRMDIDLSGAIANGKTTLSQTLTTPMAGVEVVSTDLKDLAQVRLDMLKQQQLPNGWWKDYSIGWTYDMYFPTEYNALIGQPVKVATGVGFKSNIYPLNTGEASLGYDFMFVNGQTANQYFTLTLYGANGATLNTYEGINAPLERGKLTVMRGKFLTKNHSSGTGIDPGFDGNINIDR